MSSFYERGKLAALRDMGVMTAGGAALGAGAGALGAEPGARMQGAQRGALAGGAAGLGASGGAFALQRLGAGASPALTTAAGGLMTAAPVMAGVGGYAAGQTAQASPLDKLKARLGL